jgi:hypothetical protein
LDKGGPRVGLRFNYKAATVLLQVCYKDAPSLNQDGDLAGLDGWNGFRGLVREGSAKKTGRQKGAKRGTNGDIRNLSNEPLRLLIRVLCSFARNPL